MAPENIYFSFLKKLSSRKDYFNIIMDLADSRLSPLLLILTVYARSLNEVL